MQVVGVDEVGRGCLAGPLVVGAVILNKPIAGLKDSKLLTRIQREKLALEIKQKCIASALGWVEPMEIDQLGLSASIGLAIERALSQIEAEYDQIIIDGNYNFLKGNPKACTLIRADNLIPAVSAASIIAKVARDQYMHTAALTYPNYGFESHVGYGTALHLAKLKEYGVSVIHRTSFKPVRLIAEAA